MMSWNKQEAFILSLKCFLLHIVTVNYVALSHLMVLFLQKKMKVYQHESDIIELALKFNIHRVLVRSTVEGMKFVHTYKGY